MKNTTNTSEPNISSTESEKTIKENSSELLEQVRIEETPFTAVRIDVKWFLTMGKYRLSEPVETLEQVKDNAKDASWIRIMQIIQIMIEENNNKLKEENQMLKEQVEGLKKQIH